MFRHGAVIITILAAVAGRAAGQSFNVDFGDLGFSWDQGATVANASQLASGRTHALHTYTLSSPGSITITVGPGVGGFANAGGIQLVSLGRGKLRKYVKSGASGLNNGSSWADAYTDLQNALS